MSTDTLSNELRALAKIDPGDTTRSKTARLRSVLPEVEAALAAGAGHATVVETLKGHGLDMTVRSFSSTLRRVREQKKGEHQEKTAPAPASPVGQVARRPSARPPARSAPPAQGHQLLPELSNGRAPDDMDELISHARKERS